MNELKKVINNDKNNFYTYSNDYLSASIALYEEEK
jgi:hypothetical protein